MGFPAYPPLSKHLEVAYQSARTLHAKATHAHAKMANGDVTGAWLVEIIDQLQKYRQVLRDVAAVPGIAAYAAEQYGRVIVTEFSSLISAIENVVQTTVAELDQDGSGHLLHETIAADGTRTPVMYDPAETAPIRASLAALVATIDIEP